MQARFVEAAAAAQDGKDFARRLEADDVFVRIDGAMEPDVFRGATISMLELDALRSIERVVRDKGKVVRIGTDRLELERGDVATERGRLYIDCTARGVRPTVLRPVFEEGTITLEYVTVGVIPYGAATIGAVEAMREDDGEKNRLCPPLTFTGNIADVLELAFAGMTGLLARGSEPDLAAWAEACRLNPAHGAMDRLDDPLVLSGFEQMAAAIGPAMDNLTALDGANAH